MLALYKVAWESPRFWEKENNIYGGISFLKDTVDIVWYPTDKLFSPTGVLIAGFGSERQDIGGMGMGGTSTGESSPFGALPTIEDKFAASRQAVEILHPGRSHLLSKPIYVAWSKIPHTSNSKSPKVKPTSPATTSHTSSAGKRVQSSPPTTRSSALQGGYAVKNRTQFKITQ
jgi:monoamine oxidase